MEVIICWSCRTVFNTRRCPPAQLPAIPMGAGAVILQSSYLSPDRMFKAAQGASDCRWREKTSDRDLESLVQWWLILMSYRYYLGGVFIICGSIIRK